MTGYAIGTVPSRRGALEVPVKLLSYQVHPHDPRWPALPSGRYARRQVDPHHRHPRHDGRSHRRGDVWLWEWSPIPTLLLITPLLQGLVVGAVMAFAVGRLRMRNPRVVGAGRFRLRFAQHRAGPLWPLPPPGLGDRQPVADRCRPGQVDSRGRSAVAAGAARHGSGRIVDAMLAQRTQHSGFLGSLFLRNEQGMRIKSNLIPGRCSGSSGAARRCWWRLSPR